MKTIEVDQSGGAERTGLVWFEARATGSVRVEIRLSPEQTEELREVPLAERHQWFDDNIDYWIDAHIDPWETYWECDDGDVEIPDPPVVHKDQMTLDESLAPEGQAL